MKKLWQIAVALTVTAHALWGQAPRGPRIEIRKIRTIVDHDGLSFNNPPQHVAQLSGGRFVLVEPDQVPVVIDSIGRLIKSLGRDGEGPGEFNKSANTGPFRFGLGETLFVRNNKINVFGPGLHYVRAVRSGLQFIQDFLPSPGGFIVTTPKPGPDNTSILFHITDTEGNVIRSFGSIVNLPRTSSLERRHALSPSTDGGFWAVPYTQHRLERWTSDGIRTVLIDSQPPWYVRIPLDKPGFRSFVAGFREIDGRLWVMSAVPVKNTDGIIKEATGRRYPGANEGGVRLPVERLTTTMLEVYDAKSGKLITELPVPAFGVTFIDDKHFMLFTTSADGVAQLEIWEMTLKS